MHVEHIFSVLLNYVYAGSNIFNYEVNVLVILRVPKKIRELGLSDEYLKIARKIKKKWVLDAFERGATLAAMSGKKILTDYLRVASKIEDEIVLGSMVLGFIRLMVGNLKSIRNKCDEEIIIIEPLMQLLEIEAKSFRDLLGPSTPSDAIRSRLEGIFPGVSVILECIFQKIFPIPSPEIVLTLERKGECGEIEKPRETRREREEPERTPKIHKETCMMICGEFDKESNRILIHLGCMSPDSFEDNFMVTFVHESIHAIQWNAGATTIGNIEIKCDKEIIKNTAHLPYEQRPHEQEAFKYTRPLINYITQEYPHLWCYLWRVANLLSFSCHYLP